MVVGLQFVGGNVASTAPYSHGRRFDTLEEVIDFYGRGGAALVSWVKKGDPSNISCKLSVQSVSHMDSSIMNPFKFSAMVTM